jgi:hypothetical protein
MKSSKLILGLCAALVAASAFAQATVTVYSQNPVPGDLVYKRWLDQSGTELRQPELGLQQHARRRQRRHPHQLPAQRQRLGLLQQPKHHWEGGYRVFCRPRERWRQLRTQSFYDLSSILGPLAALSHLSYEWYRDGSSTAPDFLHPVLRLGILRVNSDNSINLGYLVFERVYNVVGAAPTDSWQSDDIVSNNYKLWATASLGFGDPNVNINNVLKTIPEWVSAASARNATLYVISVNAGIGSGWNGTFTGAVDNITFGFGGNYTTYNFEVVPEPASMAALGSGLIGLLGLRRRKK